MSNLHDSVERWLVQEDYSIIETKTEDNFKIIIKNIDAFSNNLEIFEPKQQANVLVIGVKIPLKGKQMKRYRQLNQNEKENFEKKTGKIGKNGNSEKNTFLKSLTTFSR